MLQWAGRVGLVLFLGGSAQAAANRGAIDALPYAPVLDPAAMDPAVDPCVDFYAYACGGWRKSQAIPDDEASWSVYAKLGDDNQHLLWGILQRAAEPRPERTAEEQKIGDYFHSCMDEAAIDRAGLKPLQASLASIEGLKSLRDLPALLAQLQVLAHDDSLGFGWASGQDFARAEEMIGVLDAGGLGLPDRDYYLKSDKKSAATRQLYRQHIGRMLVLSGEAPRVAARHGDKILKLETALAKSSLTQVERRDPYQLYHKLPMAQLQALTPSFKWGEFFAASGTPGLAVVNVTEPKFFKGFEAQLKRGDIDLWQAYLRWHLLSLKAASLGKAVDDEHFAFYRRHLHGVQVQKPRWKRCVAAVDHDLGEALGQVYVAKTFTPEIKSRALAMTLKVEEAMRQEIEGLPWMQAKTKASALAKLKTVVNKIGYPDKWRSYAEVEIKPGDYYGNNERSEIFATRRDLAKIGHKVDRSEWQMTPPTVNAYYDPQMNNINFPAGILQPPLFDAKLDQAPNYGNTGATIGHELTHAFDDEGRQYDDQGNLRDWWTKQDAAAFERKAACVVKQYAGYTVVDDIKLNSKLTLGEDLADLGGTLIAYKAWRLAVQDAKLEKLGGFQPEQRFFIGMAQWACENQRPEHLRVSAVTNVHSPARYRVNGVVANLPEFAAAFQCKAGQPMVSRDVCKVW